MYNNEYFVVDLASCANTGEIINNISVALETLEQSSKKIILKLNDIFLNQSQLLSIQSLITSYGCSLDTIETTNVQTEQIAQNMNILIQKPIEKRVAEKLNNDTDNFNQLNNTIVLKDVNGLSYNVDLNKINLNKTNTSSDSDINFIEKQVEEKSNNDLISQVSDNYALIHDVEGEFEQKELSEEKEEKKEEHIENTEKNSIGVYKKAYDKDITSYENEIVSFYETPTNEPIITDTKETTYINQTLRSGQILEANGNVVIIGDCHPGSEIRAMGDITVWGILSGIAHAGCKGNINARIRALKLNAVQLRIGNCYSRRPDGTNIPYIIRSSVFTPEEARVVDNEIMLFKVNQN